MTNQQKALIAGTGTVVLVVLGGLVYWLRVQSMKGLASLEGVPTGQAVATAPAQVPSPPTAVPTPGPLLPTTTSDSAATRGDLKSLPADADSDGLSDAEEAKAGTDPAKRDTDGDGVGDWSEAMVFRTDPLKKDAVDNDGRPKVQNTQSEAASVIREATPTKASANVDADSDGLTDAEEKTLGTDPSSSDTDGDELGDYSEVKTYLSDPLKTDTDKDGYADADEVRKGYNPRGPGSCAKPSCIP